MTQFSKIRVAKDGVELVQKVKGSGGAEVRDFTCAQPPLPELPAAMMAFVPYVMDLLELPEPWREALQVTTLNLDEEQKTGKLGLVVTALMPVEKANDRPLVLNTPRMREWEDDGNPQPAGTFDETIAALIETAQVEARRYYRGERGQAELFETKETVAAEPEKTNGTDPAKPPRVRRQRRVQEIPEAGRVMNPEAVIPPTDEAIHKQLLISGVTVPVERIAKWVSSEREEALKFANDPEGRTAPYCVRRDMEPELATSAGD